MAECPNSIEELQELEKLIPLCRVTLYNQAKARIETGAAKSVSEASRQLAEETGRSPNTIRSAINRECGTDAVHQLSELSCTDKHRPFASSQKTDSTSDDLLNDWQEPSQREDELPFIQSEKQPETTAYNHRAIGTGENEWYTPIEYSEAARAVMGDIDLDPASSIQAQETIRAINYFTLEENGLLQEWHGRIFLNPPYTQPDIKNFIQKAVNEFEAGNIQEAIILTHNYTDTAWFHLASSVCSAICFTRGRIAFVSPEGKKAAPTQGQAFSYYGENTEAFKREFSSIGLVLMRY